MRSKASGLPFPSPLVEEGGAKRRMRGLPARMPVSKTQGILARGGIPLARIASAIRPLPQGEHRREKLLHMRDVIGEVAALLRRHRSLHVGHRGVVAVT